EVREIDVSYSFAENTLEEGEGKYCAVRLGFRQIDGFHWIDRDEERLKRQQLLFRNAPQSPITSPQRGEVDLRSKSGEGASIYGESVTPHPDRILRCDPTSPYGRGVAAPLLLQDNGQEEDWADRIIAARQRRKFTSLEDFARDTALPKRALILLADADAFRSLGLDRRAALWAVRRLPDDVPLPPFEAAVARELPGERARPLPHMPRAGHVLAG